jgi:hypothetical protein
VPECDLIADHGYVGGAAESTKVGAADFDIDAVIQAEDACGAGLDQLGEHRARLEIGMNIVEGNVGLPLIGGNDQNYAALAGDQGGVAQRPAI